MPLRKVRDADDAIRCLNASTAAGRPARRGPGATASTRSLNAWRPKS